MSETFTYDNLHRVLSRTVNTAANLSGNLTLSEGYAYDDYGNLLSKGNVGYYQYNVANKPNRLAGIWQNSNFSGTKHYAFSYDNNGNVTDDGKRSFTYTSFDKPSRITQGTNTTDFSYGPARELYKRVDVRAGQTTSTLMIDGIYEQVTLPSGVVEHKYSVGDAVVTKRSNGVNATNYVHKDHLGSTIAVTKADGNILQQFIYDPWGKQYTVYTDTLSMMNFTSEATSKGYTGHEMVNDFDVIHMGGRTYNPVLGRFMQADPHIQFAGNLQSYNRYSYVMNNPMKYTDPSGYFLAGIFKKYWRTILSIGLSIWAPWGTGFFASIATGAAAGYITTGSLKGALVGGLTAGLFHGVGTYFEGLKDSAGALSRAASAGKVLAHGLVGGVSSVLSGGKFGHGFLSAGASQALSFKIDEIGGRIGDVTSGSYFETFNRAKRIIAAALVGGTTSAITGGKFANGAVTAAFSRGFNDEAHWTQKMDSALDDIWNYTSSTTSAVWDDTVWTWNAITDGMSKDWSYGVWEFGVRFTGGRENLGFQDAYIRNWQQSSLAVGFINDFDNKVVGFLVGGAFMNKHGGMSAFSWAKSGFAPAPHLLNRTHTAAYVARSTALNTILIGGSYEVGVGIGSAARYYLNKGFIAGSDYFNDGKYKK